MKTNKLTIGIIGGTGQMGRLFKKIFEKNGHKVLIASRRTKLKIEDCASKSDIVIISVPINVTIDVIKKIGPFVKEDSLLMDFTSLKKEPVEAMLRYSKAAVIGCHPVFGPTISSIKNQVMILTPTRPKKWLPWLKNLLLKEGVKLKITTPEQHDKMMAVIQGIVHFSNIAIAHAMKEIGINIKKSLEYTSPIYKLRMAMVGRILNQDSGLYADIEILNSETKKTIRQYLKSAEKLERIINKKDRKEFIKYFNDSANFFGSFKKEATEISDYLIKQMVNKK